jgi:hypothetical protein
MKRTRPRHRNEVRVINHQAIGPDIRLPTPTRLGEHRQIDLAVIGREKHIRAPFAPMGDTLWLVNDSNPWQSVA